MPTKEKRSFALNHISVDCVILGFDGDRLNVLLKKRHDMDLHDMKLPGSLIYADEDLDQAAMRTVTELTGLKDVEMAQFQAFGSLDRTSNIHDVQWLARSENENVKRIVTVAYFAIMRVSKLRKLPNDTTSSLWVPVDELPQLAFDHNIIVAAAVNHFAQIAYFNNEYLFHLLPKKFTIYQFRKLYEIVYGTTIDPGNFHKKVTQMPYVVPLDERESGKKHRAARYFKYDSKAYRKNKI